MPTVMCRRDWPGVFRRTIAGASREFPPGVPVDLEEAELAAVVDDLGRALQPIAKDDGGQWRVVELNDDDRAALAALKAGRSLPTPPPVDIQLNAVDTGVVTALQGVEHRLEELQQAAENEPSPEPEPTPAEPSPEPTPDEPPTDERPRGKKRP